MALWEREALWGQWGYPPVYKPQSGRGKSMMMPQTAMVRGSQGTRVRCASPPLGPPCHSHPKSQREPLMRETRPLLPHTPTQASRQWSGLSQPIPFCWGYPPSPGVVGSEEAPRAQDVLPRGQRAVPGSCGNTTKSRKSNGNCYHHPAPPPPPSRARQSRLLSPL